MTDRNMPAVMRRPDPLYRLAQTQGAAAFAAAAPVWACGLTRARLQRAFAEGWADAAVAASLRKTKDLAVFHDKHPPLARHACPWSHVEIYALAALRASPLKGDEISRLLLRGAGACRIAASRAGMVHAAFDAAARRAA